MDQTCYPVQFHFHKAFAALPSERQTAALSAVAALLDITPDLFSHTTRQKKKREVTAFLPTEAVEHLHDLLQTNSGSLRLLGVDQVTLMRASGEMEQWRVAQGQFDLEASIPAEAFEETDDGPTGPVPRIWLFHLIYFFVTGVLSVSIFQYSPAVALSLLLMTLACAGGMLLARFRRSLYAHVLAVAVGLTAPIIIFGRLWPLQTLLFFTGLALVVFIIRRFIF